MLSGETGWYGYTSQINGFSCQFIISGKSTQLPAFILEDQLSRGQHCKIYCTEPRRISAISLAQRVSRELGDAPNAVGTLASLVGYSIRLESNTSRNTRLAFVTNGIALRMLEGGSGQGGHGTAFDEITASSFTQFQRAADIRFSISLLTKCVAVRPTSCTSQYLFIGS